METTHSSETSVLTRPQRRQMPEDDILQSNIEPMAYDDLAMCRLVCEHLILRYLSGNTDQRAQNCSAASWCWVRLSQLGTSAAIWPIVSALVEG
jgi:hypothetical protein